MKSILEFDLPEEQDEHRVALDGYKWKCAMEELDQYYRGIVKYGDDEIAAEHAEKVRDKLREILEHWSLMLD